MARSRAKRVVYRIKEITVGGETQKFRIVEPVVKDPGTTFHLTNNSIVIIKPASSNAEWEIKIINCTTPYKVTLGTDAAKYWYFREWKPI